MSRKDEDRATPEDPVTDRDRTSGQSPEASPDRHGDRGRGRVPGEPGAWPARVHVSEADRSELLNRIVGG